MKPKSPRQTMYGHAWRKARREFLGAHPLCALCQQQGHIVPATVVDHITPHKGDEVLFWDVSQWQALCKPHHDGAKQHTDRTGHVSGCDADGAPLDHNSHWGKG